MRALQASGCGATPSPSTSATRDAASSVPPSAVVRNRQTRPPPSIASPAPARRRHQRKPRSGGLPRCHAALAALFAAVAHSQRGAKAGDLAVVGAARPTCSNRTQSPVLPSCLSQSVRMRSPTALPADTFRKTFDFGGTGGVDPQTGAPSIRRRSVQQVGLAPTRN